MNKLLLEEYKNSLGISEIKVSKKTLDCEDFLDLSEQFLMKEKSCSEKISESVVDQIMKIVSDTDDDNYSEYDLKFYSLVQNFCESKTQMIEGKKKRINRNLSRIAKRRWVRYKQKYLRVLRDAQESFKTKQCQKNLKNLLKKESFLKEDVYDLIKAMNSSVTHYLIYNEISEKSENSKLPIELIEELNELQYSLFKESINILESKELKSLNENIRDIVIFANEVFCDSSQNDLIFD